MKLVLSIIFLLIFWILLGIAASSSLEPVPAIVIAIFAGVGGGCSLGYLLLNERDKK